MWRRAPTSNTTMFWRVGVGGWRVRDWRFDIGDFRGRPEPGTRTTGGRRWCESEPGFVASRALDSSLPFSTAEARRKSEIAGLEISEEKQRPVQKRWAGEGNAPRLKTRATEARPRQRASGRTKRASPAPPSGSKAWDDTDQERLSSAAPPGLGNPLPRSQGSRHGLFSVGPPGLADARLEFPPSSFRIQGAISAEEGSGRP
jgi:hypothetical protein